MIFGRPLAPWWRLALEPFGCVLEHALEHTRATPENLVPIKLEDLIFANLHREKFPHAICPSTEVASMLDSPTRFGQWARDNGLGDYVPARHQGEFPCVLKEDRHSDSSQGVHICRTQAELDEVQGLMRCRGTRYVVQAAVSAQEEFVTHSLVYQGEIVHDLTLRIDFPHELYKKDRPYEGTVVCPGLPALQEMYRRMKYTGFACANYKMPAGREVYFEINPRIGASLLLPAHNQHLREFLLAADTF
jgi:hypothetical protein